MSGRNIFYETYPTGEKSHVPNVDMKLRQMVLSPTRTKYSKATH